MAYPEYEHIWQVSPSKEYQRHGFWKDKRNQRMFFHQLASKWNLRTLDDWYKVKSATVVNEGGTFINNYYGGSIHKGKEYIVCLLTL
jgi:hypothetical protein